MIKNQWYAVMDSGRVKQGEILSAVRLNRRLAFFRTKDGKAHAVEDKCAHRGARLSQGVICGDELQCPFHGLEYSADGRCSFIPSEGLADQSAIERFHVKSFPLMEKNDILFLWYGDGPAIGEPDVYEELSGDLVFAETWAHWPVHYSRVIENQLDVSHLPFVHGNTIGRGHKTLVHGPKLEWLDDNTLRTAADNERDVGQRRRHADEARIKETNLRFKFPNQWLNTIKPGKIYVFAYFIPVTEGDTILALRFYHKLTPFKPLNRLIAKIGSKANVVIQAQDLRLVRHQRPPKTELKGTGDQLLEADGPILAYRKKRQALKEEEER